MERRVGLEAESHVLEEEELDLRAEERLVSDAKGGEVRFGLGRNVARITRVAVARQRVVDVADQLERRLRLRRVDPSRVEVRTQQHIGFFDRLETAQAGAVEALTAFDEALVHIGGRDREVVPAPDQVGDEQVHPPYVVV